ncbi:hypothetical protein ACFX12_023350 [Malus domestica]
MFEFSDKSSVRRDVKLPNVSGSAPWRLVECISRVTSLVRLNNQGDNVELKSLFERSRTERDAKFMDGRVRGRTESPQEGKCNSTSQGSILTVGSQCDLALLRSTPPRFRYFKEERVGSHRRSFAIGSKRL